MTIALRTVFMLFGISCIGAFHPMHDFLKRQIPQEASNTLREFFRRQTEAGYAADRPCTAVTSNLQAFIEFETKNTPLSIQNFLEFVSSVNHRDFEELQALVCHFVEDSTDDFVRYLRDTGIEYTILRRLYGYTVVSVETSLSHHPGHRNDIPRLILRSGFADLDDEGVQQTMPFYLDSERGDDPELQIPTNCSEIQERFSGVTFLHLLPNIQRLSLQISTKSPSHFPQPLIVKCSLTCLNEVQDLIDSHRLVEILVDFGKEQMGYLRHVTQYLKEAVNQEEEVEEGSWREMRQRRQRVTLNLLLSLKAAGVF
ncbi:hypothetical protein CAPTEDRAFT_192720 [Capitella teleta]|uniref:Uncharacterized protein n=1 Tax=Capitella teleta TaxID=283909 RepID=R7TFY7_CAPTE|nr:hypothetical protein CAPTEDRAFT_192720 [Capitella teleta]|eukprot:ELT92392.1 hypothetical protein CAPTEDRAFT_192720 [Capitella teleta]